MRWVKSQGSANQAETGAVAVIVAIGMIALLGMAALVIDVGAMYAEKAQLQNGADAAALAIAATCADNESDPLCESGSSLADTYADANAGDGATAITGATVDKAANSVHVADTNETAAGDEHFSLVFARIFGMDTTQFGAEATAVWSGVGSGPAVFPIIFKRCEFVESIINGAWQVLDFHGSAGCDNNNPSGQNYPGAFGWLDQAAGSCASPTLQIGQWAGGDTGVAFPGSCQAVVDQWKAELAAGQQVYIILPIYDDGRNTGSNTEYRVSGYVTFEITGWRFTGGNNYNNTTSPYACTGSCQGFIGRYIDESTDDGSYEGGGPNLGASIIELTQ